MKRFSHRSLLGRTRQLFNKLAEIRLRKHSKLWDQLQQYLSQSKSTGCNYLGYWELYKLVRKYKPREILECGTGVSTLVLAYAIAENRRDFNIDCRITSMEEIAEYLEMSRACLPAEYQPVVDFVQSDRVEDSIGLFRGLRYRDIPNRPYDFIFVDGPDYTTVNGQELAFDFDAIHVAKNSTRPINGLIDKRVSTSFVLQTLFGSDAVSYVSSKHLGYIHGLEFRNIQLLPKGEPSSMFQRSFRLFGKTNLRYGK